MPEYRRVLIPGGVYFFTLVTYERRKIFSSPIARKLFFKAVEHVHSYHPFTIIAYYLLPDHIHFIWQMPENECDYSKRISAIKRRFTILYRQYVTVPLPENESRIKRRESTVWQRRFWEHYIRDQKDLDQHLDYLHYNPVKHGLVDQVKDWKASSFSRYVKLGYYDLDWGGKYPINDYKINFGE
ncbi:MAG: transposase [Chloroflexi bacterium]|jgi:putative transposase|nr:transposase [Chloroflexota bacterium]